jgi:hypothetical protein
MRISALFLVAAMLFVGSAPSSISATLTSYVSKEGKVIVVLNGEIVPGDAGQLQQIIKRRERFWENCLRNPAQLRW